MNKIDKSKEKKDIVKMINEGKTVQIMVDGYSMYPLVIPERDWVILNKADTGKIKRGDVVLYRRDSGILVLHRVWKKKSDGFYMVGDNQSVIEGPLRNDQIIAVLAEVIRNGRKFSVKNHLYILFSRIWLIMRPVRMPVSRIIHKIKQCTFKNTK